LFNCVCDAFGGELIFASLVKMALRRGEGFWEMFSHSFSCEPRPRGEMAIIDGVNPRSCDWAEGGGMEELDVLDN
jgi:hypothetical protein